MTYDIDELEYLFRSFMKWSARYILLMFQVMFQVLFIFGAIASLILLFKLDPTEFIRWFRIFFDLMEILFTAIRILLIAFLVGFSAWLIVRLRIYIDSKEIKMKQEVYLQFEQDMKKKYKPKRAKTTHRWIKR